MQLQGRASSVVQSLPILDLRQFDGDDAERWLFLERLRDAARDVGFFYLVGHGVSDALVETLLSLSRRFFELPEAEKLAIEMVNSPHFRGYTRVGWEHTRGKPDWREQLDVGAERPALSHAPDQPAWTRLQGPNQWPAALPELRPVLLRWQEEATARSGWYAPLPPVSVKPKISSNRSTPRSPISSSRSSTIRAEE